MIWPYRQPLRCGSRNENMVGALTTRTAAFAVMLVHVAGCVAIAPAGIAHPPGQLFEPHDQVQPGTAVVYLYYYETRVSESDLPVSATHNAGRGDLQFFVNGKKAAPLILGGYAVVEVSPGETLVEIKHPEELVAASRRPSPPQYPSSMQLAFTAYANQIYYLRSRTVITKEGRGPFGVASPELTVERTTAEMALRHHLPRLRLQESYL